MNYKGISIDQVLRIAAEAAAAVLKIYNDPQQHYGLTTKTDNSPLTLADQIANNIITSQLKILYPNIPVISEEERLADDSDRRSWETFWLVDPLDGTKEFLKHNGEFTVNIGLIENNYPTFGVIHIPVTGEAFFGATGIGAYKNVEGNDTQIFARTPSQLMTALGSRSHASEQEQSVLDKYQVKAVHTMGSSLKFCRMAEGKADLYYRHNPTMEWDTAAGQAILESSGGVVYSMDGTRFKYNKPDLRNGAFLCLGQNAYR